MDRSRALLIAGGAIGVGGLTFVGIRYALRMEVAKTIAVDPMYQRTRQIADASSSLLGFDIGLPQPDELAASLVPLFSTVSPYEAADDIQFNGRRSKYWPKKYRRSDIPPQVEDALMRLMVRVSQSKNEPQAQVAA